MLLGHERNYGLGMDALGDRMLLEHERNYGLGMDALGDRMLLEHERNYGLGMDALGERMLLEHERNYGLGMDALVTVCSWDTNGIMVWAWMLWVTVCSLEHEQNYAKICSCSTQSWSANHAMCGGSSDFEASESPKALFVPRRPALMGSGESAFFAR